MKKDDFKLFQSTKKEAMHYDEMSEEEKHYFDEKMDALLQQNELDSDENDCIDSKHEGDYINEEDLEIDDAL